MDLVGSKSLAARELRARRAVAKLGYSLRRSRRRNPEFPDYGLYRIIEPSRNWVVAGGRPLDFSLDLDDVESWVAQARTA